MAIKSAVFPSGRPTLPLLQIGCYFWIGGQLPNAPARNPIGNLEHQISPGPELVIASTSTRESAQATISVRGVWWRSHSLTIVLRILRIDLDVELPISRLQFLQNTLLADILNLPVPRPKESDYFFTSGGYFFKSFATALLRFFSCLSGLAFGSMVLETVPRQTRSFFADSYMSRSNCPT